MLVVVALDFLVIREVRVKKIDGAASAIHVMVSTDKQDEFQLFFAEKGKDFVEKGSVVLPTFGKNEKQVLDFPFTFFDAKLRFDPGHLSKKVTIYQVSYEVDGIIQRQSPVELFKKNRSRGIQNIQQNADGSVTLTVSTDDPELFVTPDWTYFVEAYQRKHQTANILAVILICLVITGIGVFSMKHFSALTEVPIEIIRSRKLEITLAKSDFKTKYAGSYLGIVWAFIQPVTTILVYWFVFQVGLKSGGMTGYPFVIYLVTGIVPWFFFSDALTGGMNALVEYSYLVKKVVFNIDILPVVKVLSAVFVHLFFIMFTVILTWLYGYPPTWYILQVPYYVLCNLILVLGLAYLCSAITVFFRDLTQFINIVVLQVGVWLTPIMWDASSMLPGWLLRIFKLNPMYYITDGFRDSFLYQRCFFSPDKLPWSIYFWVITFLIFGFGTMIFRRLKVHFADVL